LTTKNIFFQQKHLFLFNFAMLIRYIGDMTSKEFEHKAMKMRIQALKTACKFGFSPEEAEDVAQDVMLRLWAMHERIGANDPVERLASIAARHRCIDKLRLRNSQKNIEDYEACSQEQNQHEELEYKELEQWLLRQIEQLPNTCGIVLKMRQLEHRDIDEIAALLGISKSSVSALLSRARNLLLQKIERRKRK
jgi:RNA polymerase sigma-70 factor (ECF subfamily)